MKKEILEFIQARSTVPEMFADVVDYVVKDKLDDNGNIGEHFIVKVIVKVPDTSIPVYNYEGRLERTCLVNKEDFYQFIREKSSVIWI